MKGGSGVNLYLWGVQISLLCHHFGAYFASESVPPPPPPPKNRKERWAGLLKSSQKGMELQDPIPFKELKFPSLEPTPRRHV